MRLAMTFDQFAAALVYLPAEYQGGTPLYGLSARDSFLEGWEAFLLDAPLSERWPLAKKRGWREAEARTYFARRVG